MAGIEFTPRDKLTGLPYSLFYGPEDILDDGELDFHHHEHPEDAAELKSPAGQALRIARGQLVPVYIHNIRYHKETYRGPILPVQESTKARLALLELTDILPRISLDLTEPGAVHERFLTDEEHAFLSDPQRMYMEDEYHPRHGPNNRKFLRKFFAEQFVKNCLPEEVASGLEIDELLHSKDPQRIRELGSQMLRGTADMVISPLEDIYNRARDEGMTTPRQITPQTVIRNLFLLDGSFRNYAEQLQSHQRKLVLAA